MNKILIYILFLLTTAFSSSIMNKTDSDAIRESLKKRDDYYTRHLGNFQRDGLPSTATIKKRLSESGNSSSLWYSFLMAEASEKKDNKRTFFNRSIKAAQKNIGDLWVLFLEFHKLGELEYEKEILDHLELIALETGVEVLPAISQQLVILAEQENEKGRNENALFYLNSAKRFSGESLPVSMTQLLVKGSETNFLSLQKQYSESLSHSWRAQLNLIQKVSDSLFSLLYVITFLLFTILILKYYPRTIHNLTCLYPKGVPYQMRFFYTTLILLVSLVFGIYPVAIFLVILMTRVPLQGGGKVAVRALLVLMLLTPLTTFINARLAYTLSGESPISLYERALREQPTAELYSTIRKHIEDENAAPQAKALHYTSLAIIQFKRNSVDAAVSMIRSASSLWSESEPVLIAAGNIYHKAGDSEQAFRLFEKATSLFPESPEINYNYGQINLEQVGITDGTDYINKGSELAPSIVNGFINRNSNFFGESEWPATRRFFMGALSTEQFWKHFAAFSTPPAGTLDAFWGSTFLGFPLYASLIFIVLALIISALIVPSYAQVKKSGECVLCGKPICKKCRVNDICNECHVMLHNITNESLVDSIKVKLSVNKRNIILWRAHVCDLFFPGTLDIFLKKKSKKRLYTFIPITVLVYTYYAIVLNFPFSLFSQVSIQLTLGLLIPAVLYNLYFIVTNLRGIFSSAMKGGK